MTEVSYCEYWFFGGVWPAEWLRPHLSSEELQPPPRSGHRSHRRLNLPQTKRTSHRPHFFGSGLAVKSRSLRDLAVATTASSAALIVLVEDDISPTGDDF